MEETPKLEQAVKFLKQLNLPPPQVVVVLGSGLGALASKLKDARSVPFALVPNWPAPRVQGHVGTLIVGQMEGITVACLTGRVHLYEGFTAHDVVRALRTLRLVGAEIFLLTNAAGGVNRTFIPGDVMSITDHLNLTGRNPLVGLHEEMIGPRFPDQSGVYALSLRTVLHACDEDLRDGVYAGLLGPSYETPAEVRMLERLGADAVGMSTVLEATALSAMGARVAGLSLISNVAAGLRKAPLKHEEVLEVGKVAEGRLLKLLERALPRMCVPDA